MFVERIRDRCASGEPADGQPVASDSSTAAKLLSACCRVVRVHGWRGAHAWCVRVERALHARARVQGAEQREGAQARQADRNPVRTWRESRFRDRHVFVIVTFL